MTRDIKEFIKRCALCEQSKVNKHTRAPLQITSVANHPFQRVYLDIYGPIPSYNGQDYVLTTICELSKCVTATAIPNATALTVADTFIREVILRFGFVETIISDNGPCFIADILKEMAKLLRIRRILTTPYNPRANDVERFHRYLGNYIKTVIEDSKERWPDMLPYAVFTYNNTFNTATGFSPFEIVFGRTFELPPPIFTPTYNYDSYINSVKENLKRCTQIAKENILKRKEQNQRQYNKNNTLKMIKLKLGDKFLMLKQGHKHKFDKNYIGPYTVHEFVPPTTVVYKRGNKLCKIHIDKVKLAEANYDK